MSATKSSRATQGSVRRDRSDGQEDLHTLGEQCVTGGGMLGQDQHSWVLKCGDAETGGLRKKVMRSA